MTKIYGLLQLTFMCTLHYCVISIDSYSQVNKFDSFVIFSLLINAVILLLNCLVLRFFFFTYIFFLLDIIFFTETLFGPLYN